MALHDPGLGSVRLTSINVEEAADGRREVQLEAGSLYASILRDEKLFDLHESG